MDRTETLGTVWLGLTVGCARCHNHKYDSITQDEYYQLFAFFNNADESTFELSKDEKVRVVSQRNKDIRRTHVLRRGGWYGRTQSPDYVAPQVQWRRPERCRR